MRRDPLTVPYSSTMCTYIQRGQTCPQGDTCPFAHSIFESWLHPTRFRTKLCKFGTRCTRPVCFFAHSPQELRRISSSGEVSGLKMTGTLSAEATPSVVPGVQQLLTPAATPRLAAQQQPVAFAAHSIDGNMPTLSTVWSPQTVLAQPMQQLVQVPVPYCVVPVPPEQQYVTPGGVYIQQPAQNIGAAPVQYMVAPQGHTSTYPGPYIIVPVDASGQQAVMGAPGTVFQQIGGDIQR